MDVRKSFTIHAAAVLAFVSLLFPRPVGAAEKVLRVTPNGASLEAVAFLGNDERKLISV